jgi:ADP-ribose pyrophosphatase
MYMFCGLVDLSDRGGVFGLDEENEDILFQVWPYNDAIEALNDGLLNSAAMTIAMLWLQLKRDDLRLES